MVNSADHIVPLVAVLLMWFFATGMVAWLDNRPRATFARALSGAGLVGCTGLVMVAISATMADIAGVYLGFAGALLIWSWHEIGFLMGAATGPRRALANPGARGWPRFVAAAATLIHHEIALLLTALMLASLCFAAANPMGALTFGLFLALRLASKFNLYVGVPNAQFDILPPHLAYLTSYFGPARLHALLPLTIAVIAAGAVWLGQAALAAPVGSAAAVQYSLLSALAALGVVEHLFLVLPLRDGAVWGWALPGRRPG